MEQQFRSAVSRVLVGVMVAVLTPPVCLSVRNGIWPLFLLLAGTLACAAYFFYTTIYTIRGNELYVRSGFFKMAPIDILSISRIRRSNNPLSAPAASLRRLEIRYGKGKFLLVSPKEEAEFIGALQAVQPAIEVQL